MAWHVRTAREAEKERHGLERHFRAAWPCWWRALRFRRRARIAALAVGAAAIVWGLSSLSPWPPMTTLKHIASFPNCRAARAVGLAPARRGEPGYWQRHDRDADGIACEPWSPRDPKPRLPLPKPPL